MTQAFSDFATSNDQELDLQLYRHVKRPEWGAALLVKERDGARAYQFEDGQERKIRKGYYKLMEEADDLGEREEPIRENLRRVVQAGGNDDDTQIIEAVCPFSGQVALFTKLYPGGFEDPEWIEDHRRPDGSPLKRHRTPISKEAQEALSQTRCEEALKTDGHLELFGVVVDLLARTDLVPVSHPRALKGLEDDEKRRWMESAIDLLHGESRYEERFKNYLVTMRRLLGERPSWRVATTLSGLVHPQTHTVVRRSAFVRQAGSIAPTASYTRRARVQSYRNFQRVAVGVRERLNALGHEPRDLLDVYDFVWTTLRTSALEHLGD